MHQVSLFLSPNVHTIISFCLNLKAKLQLITAPRVVFSCNRQKRPHPCWTTPEQASSTRVPKYSNTASCSSTPEQVSSTHVPKYPCSSTSEQVSSTCVLLILKDSDKHPGSAITKVWLRQETTQVGVIPKIQRVIRDLLINKLPLLIMLDFDHSRPVQLL